MENDSGLLLDLVVAIAIALAGGWIAARLRFSPVVGYLAAGLVISPFTPGFVGDVERLRLMADIGVVLLMFGIGVQFSLKEIAAAGPKTLGAAAAQVAAVMLIPAALAAPLGWDWKPALYAGAAAAISSSTLAVKLLADRGEERAAYGRLTVSWAIAQDIASLAVVAVLVAISQEGDIATGLGSAGLKALGFIVVIVALGVRPIPWLLNRISEIGSRELFVLAIAALALGTALASEEAGLSLALGAFLAGIVVSESDVAHRVLGELLPARDVFGVLFFVAAGMLIDPDVIADDPLTLIGLLALMVPVKGAAIYALATAASHSLRISLLASAALAQAGEFSFVLIALGVDEGIVGDNLFSLVVSATAISMALTPLVTGVAFWLASRRREAPTAPAPPGAYPVGRRVIICGYGDTGRFVARALAPRFEAVVVEQNGRRAREAAREVETITGDASNPYTLRQLGLFDCRLLVVAISDPFTTRLIVERARELHPGIDIITRAFDREEAERLYRSGAAETIIPEREAALEMIRHALHRFGIDQRQALAIVQRLRRT